MGEGEKRATARRAHDEKGLHLLLESRARDEHEVYDREDQRDEEQVAHLLPERVPVADALAHALNALLVVTRRELSVGVGDAGRLNGARGA